MVALLFVGAAVARADEKPWAAGVAPEAQKQALALFNEGNRFFQESQYSQALEKYRQAIPFWDHPAIRFNMAVCFINLDQPLDANDNVERALRYGEAPFETHDLYAQAVNYRKLLEGRLTTLTIASPQPGARISLDGKELLTGPGETKIVLLPGPHQITANKEGFLAITKPLVLFPGRVQGEEIRLLSLEEATHYERRWAVWKPWAVVGAGAAVGLIGLWLELTAKSDFDSYDNELATTCPEGCQSSAIPASLQDVKSRAQTENVLAVSAFVAGGAAVATGIVLAIMNRERPVIRREDPLPATPAVSVVPIVGPHTAAFSMGIRF
jgi:hypothetical protein